MGADDRDNGVVSENKDRAVFLVSQLAMPTWSLPGVLRVPGLKTDARYRVTVLDEPALLAGGGSGHTMRVQPAWLHASVALSGEWLANAGLTLPVLDPESALLLGFEEIR